jgi:DNA-binding transcriptional MocR family regulator
MIPSMPTPVLLYRDLSDRLAGLIRAGTFSAGDRLPSIRHISREHHVSITTAVGAYRRLEDDGLIEARPRSGYFVKPPVYETGRSFSAATQRPAKPVLVSQSAIFEAIMDSVENRRMVPFASAAPDDALIPHRKLAAISNAIIRKHGAEALRYTPPTGRRELRVALSRRLLALGIKAAPDEIITTHGATEALLLSLRATTRRGDIVAVESPTYFGILNLIRDLGLRALEIPVDPRDGLSLEALEIALKKHRIAACVVQPNFHNPTGCLMPDARKKHLATLSTRHGFAIIEDDVYGELSHDGRRPASIGLHGGNVIHCGCTSKTLAPGLRVGWLVPGKYLAEIKRLKLIQCPWNATLSELIVAGFLDEGGYDRHLRRLRAIYAQQSQRMRQAISRAFPESAAARISQPAGGFVLWVEMPARFDSETFAVDAISKGISIVPGTLFSPSGGLKNCFRLSCGAAIGPRELTAITTLGTLASHHLR